MLEFLVVIPLIAMVIAAVFFFAWGLRNRMGLKMADRFMAWQAVRGPRQVPERFGPTWHDVIMRGLLMNRTIKHIYYDQFNKYAQTAQTPRDLSDYVADYSPPAGPVAERMLLRRWPLGSGFAITEATFPTPAGIWEKLAGEYRSRYIRDGVAWRCGQAANEEDLTDEFQKELDDALMSVPDISMKMAKIFQRLYLETWPRADR